MLFVTFPDLVIPSYSFGPAADDPVAVGDSFVFEDAAREASVDPTTCTDDVYIDGNIITAENYHVSDGARDSIWLDAGSAIDPTADASKLADAEPAGTTADDLHHDDLLWDIIGPEFG